jgi:subtilisin family serine protease
MSTARSLSSPASSSPEPLSSGRRRRPTRTATGYSGALQAAVDYAWSKGVVLVAATGNDGSSSAAFPAGDRGVIGVSNTDQFDTLNASSNFGADTFLAAPGTDILTVVPGGGTTSVTGTSASAAHVAAAAALLRAADGSGLLYQGNGNWQFNWKTPKAYAGQCRTMYLNLSDVIAPATTPVDRTAMFQFN